MPLKNPKKEKKLNIMLRMIYKGNISRWQEGFNPMSLKDADAFEESEEGEEAEDRQQAVEQNQ